MQRAAEPMSTETKELKAGRELDSIVGEKVMGIRWDESRCRVCGWKLAASVEEGCVVGNCSMRPPPARIADEPRHYSTVIGDAWEVVIAMQKKGCSLEITADDQMSNYCAQFEAMDEGGQITLDGCERSTSLPEAICLAALAALRSCGGSTVSTHTRKSMRELVDALVCSTGDERVEAEGALLTAIDSQIDSASAAHLALTSIRDFAREAPPSAPLLASIEKTADGAITKLLGAGT